MKIAKILKVFWKSSNPEISSLANNLITNWKKITNAVSSNENQDNNQNTITNTPTIKISQEQSKANQLESFSTNLEV